MSRLLIPQKPILTNQEILRLANILDNAGQVFLGLMVISPFIQQPIDRFNWFVIILGSLAMTLSWLTSLILTRKAQL